MPTFSNQAQLSYNGITANSNIAYGQILEVLAASKTALSDTYTSGDRITYIFSIVNSGTTAFSDLTVTDNLGAYSFTTDTPETITLYPLTYIPNSMQLLINGTLACTNRHRRRWHHNNRCLYSVRRQCCIYLPG